jgi:membrane-bound lytic murein transglycosylase A
MRIRIFLSMIVLFTSCARAPLKDINGSMRKSDNPPVLTDSLPKETFFATLRKHIDVMKTSRQVMDPMTFGERKIAKKDYIASLERIFENQENWLDYIGSEFDFYEVYGQEDWGEVMSTGYYEPKVLGSMKPTERHFQPIYSTPSDMLSVDLNSFAFKMPHGEKLGSVPARLSNQKIVAYYNRKEIDVDNKLKDQNAVLAWLDPIDAFFIQIQGSGVVEFENGEQVRFGYAAQNGHPYVPIGRFLHEHISKEDMSMQRIRLHMKTLPKNEQQEIMNKNPSYVFFKKLDSGALTYAGMEVSPGRTIATDLKLFPKGGMAFFEIEEPTFNSAEDLTPSGWEKKPRLVFDQDTGGAIRGGGRVDLFFGQGDVAAQKAGIMKQKGKLFYLVPRKI